jgi:hypothetical protein
VAVLSRWNRRTVAVFLEHVCAPDAEPGAGVSRAVVLDEIEHILAAAPRLAQRAIRLVLGVLEWGGVAVWGALAAAAALALAGRLIAAVCLAALALPACLVQRPPPAPLSLCPAAWQRAYLRSLAHSGVYLRRMGFKLVAAIVLNAYYGQPSLQRALGYDVDARVAWSRAAPNPGSVLDGAGQPSGEGLPPDGTPAAP